MTEESIVLENVQVDSHGQLTGKVRQGGKECTAFTELFQRIQNHFSDEQMVSMIPHNIKRSELCVGKSSKDKKWHRVRVESVLSTGHGFQASCFFVDAGSFEMVPLAFLRHIPETYLQVPFQLKKLYLYGITPITLAMSSYDLMTSMERCRRWDSAAVEFIKKNVELSHRFNAIVMEEKQDGSLGIRLYLTVGRTQFCLNERLVKERYATFMTDDDEESMEPLPIAAKPKRTIAEVLKSKKINLKEPTPSDGEDQHYVSEPELKFGLNQSSGGSDPERGYTTDSLVIPHRHRQSRVTRSPQKYHGETVSGNKSIEEILSKTEHFSDSQEKPRNFHVDKGAQRKKAIFDKLEASLRSSSGRSSPLSDNQSQENFPVHERQSFKGSQSSLARLQISSTTVTSYKQTGSISDDADFSLGAQSNISKFQTVSQVSPHYSDHSDFSHSGQSNKSKSQTVSQLSSHHFDNLYHNHDAQSNKSKFQTLSQKSPQTVPHTSSQTASKSSIFDFMKGYQSDTSHVHIKPDPAIKQTSLPHMCSDTENDRLVPYTKLDSVKFQKGQKGLQFALQQNNSPQGVKSDSSDSILPSPLVSILKEFSASNSSLSDSGSLGRGRGIISPISGRGIASTSRCRGDGSPGSGRGFESQNSDRGNGSPNKGRGIASLVASQGNGSPIRGRGIGSPVRGRGSLSPVGRGTTITYSPTKPGSSRNNETIVRQSVNDKYCDEEMPESPVAQERYSGNQKSPGFMENSRNKYFHDKTDRLSDSGSMSSDKGSVSKPGRKSVFDKITDVCSKSPVPSTSDADMSVSSRENVQQRHENVANMHKSVSAISNSSQINVRENQTKVCPSGKSINTQDFFRERNILSSDNEGAFLTQKQIRMPKQNLYSSETETDNFQHQKHHKIDKPAAYSSGTDTDSMSLLAKSATGQQVFTKARLPREATQNLRKSPEKSFRVPPEICSPVVEQETRRPQQDIPIASHIDSELNKPLKRLTVTEAGDGTGKLEDQKQKLMAKITGQRLLKNIKEGSRKQRTSPRDKQEKGMFGVENNVLVHGNNAKKPIYKFSDARFAEIVSQYWIQRDFPSPQIVQAYSWPAIRGGKHVVAISPQRSGKTLAYLCPLITSLTDQRLYKEIGTGNGPYLLILTSSWRKADAVFLETMKLLGGRPDLRLLLLHGGGQEENKGCQLINGCEILVVTPPSLKRVMDSGYTDLQRLCHLVIDDAEEIMENFGEEIKFIMQQYTEVILNQRLLSEVPRQLLLFGTQWTGRIHSFMNRYPVEPLLIITSAFEASIYGRVKQITHMCKVDDRAREIIGILDNLTEENRTVIFASKKHDVVNLYNIVRNYSRFCRKVHQDMEMFEIGYVAEEWRQHNVNLLICCDDHISEMKISDASTIINYDLPSSKTKFCNRLACLRKYFWDFSSDEECTVQPVSHLMITEGVLSSQAVSILQLLKRSNSQVPQQLKALMAGVKRGKEEEDEKELCSQLLAFGFCRNQWKCPCRHIVFPDLDHTEESNWLPDEGEVQVFVTHVIDATHYYVRLMSVRHCDSKEELGTIYSKLQMDMGLWYGNLSNLIRHKSPYEGEICGFQDRENFYRVQILHFKDMNCKGAVNIDVTVKFVDSGRVEDIPAHKLYELPAHLKEVPFQAVEVFVCRVKPIDRDTEWTNKADRFIYSLLHDKIVEGKIVLR